MNITITGCTYSPEWETLQELIRQTGIGDGKLTRINRTDNGCHYRGLGEYELDYLKMDGETVNISLVVKG